MLKLESYSVDEKKGTSQYWSMDEITFDRYNLIIGKNATGKSQLFNRLNFLRCLHEQDGQTPSIITDVHSKITFKNTKSGDEIFYEVIISPGHEVREKIENKTKKIILFNSDSKEFYNEKTNKIEHRLIVKKHSVTKLIADDIDKYPTIKQIGDFFAGIKILRTDRYDPSSLSLSRHQLVPDDNLRNLGSVVLLWKDQKPELYHRLLNTFKTFFFEIKDFTDVPKANLPILGFIEKNVTEVFDQTECSMGMLRILGLIALSISEDPKTGKVPSLLMIDEIDKGLDYENVGLIIEYVKEQSSESQIIFSSHSPITCNFVEPHFWRILSRQGVHVQAKVPTATAETMELINSSNMTNWEIYQKHISKSKLYSVQ